MLIQNISSRSYNFGNIYLNINGKDYEEKIDTFMSQEIKDINDNIALKIKTDYSSDFKIIQVDKIKKDKKEKQEKYLNGDKQ